MNDNKGRGIPTAVFDFGGLLVAEGIGPTGATLYVVLGDVDGPFGCACIECAPHEQLGPLPDRYRLDRHCTATRRDGHPCNGYRMHGSSLCQAHANAPTRLEAKR